MDAYIKHISYYLPDKILDNEELNTMFPEWSVDKVAKKTGILRRHISAHDCTAGDMAYEAAKLLFLEHSIDPASIDFVLLCTQSPDYHLPTTACILQHRLDIPVTAGALDFNLGCSGYIYGLALAKGLISAGIASNILLLTAETYTKYIADSDKGNRSIFGDGASATLISTEGFARISDFVLGTDGSGADNLIVKAGGARSLAGDQSDFADGHLFMDGPEIFNFTLEAVPPLVADVLNKNGMTASDIDLVVMHQANSFILKNIRTLCGFDKDKFIIDLEDTGNTVSSTIPIILSKLKADDAIPNGANVLLAGFGVGYSYGATILTT